MMRLPRRCRRPRTRALARQKFTCNRNAIIRKSGAREFRRNAS